MIYREFQFSVPNNVYNFYMFYYAILWSYAMTADGPTNSNTLTNRYKLWKSLFDLIDYTSNACPLLQVTFTV